MQGRTKKGKLQKSVIFVRGETRTRDLHQFF